MKRTLYIIVFMNCFAMNAADSGTAPGAAEQQLSAEQQQRIALTEMLFASVKDQGADMFGDSSGALSELIAAGADPKAQEDDTGMSPLMHLASLQDFEGAQELLTAVANSQELVAQTNDVGHTALDIARQKTRSADDKLVQLLEQHVPSPAAKGARKVG